MRGRPVSEGTESPFGLVAAAHQLWYGAREGVIRPGSYLNGAANVQFNWCAEPAKGVVSRPPSGVTAFLGPNARQKPWTWTSPSTSHVPIFSPLQ